MTKLNKRKKYLNYFDVYNCIDTDLYNFEIYGYATNKRNGVKTYDVMILDFYKGSKRLDDKQLEKLKKHIAECYPNAIVRIVTERHRYAPELNKDLLSVSTK